jgi:formiminotetrahydrofolate cyclodeaminase
MANAGVQSAILNVKINLSSIKDEKFVKKISEEIKKIEKNAADKTGEVMKIVDSKV